MTFLGLTNVLSRFQRTDHPENISNSTGLSVALIHGLSARDHMQRHLLSYLRECGFSDTTLYGHLQARLIAADLADAARQGNKIALIGYSQGGLEAVRVANILNQRGTPVDLLVTIAAGGFGRTLLPHRFTDDPRTIPANVSRCLNYFAEDDKLGTDKRYENNLARPVNDKQHVENIFFTKSEDTSHLTLTKCYPESKVNPSVRDKLLLRIKTELASMQTS